MINVSNEFKQVINGDERVFYPSAEITLADSTVLSIGKERITQLKIEDSTSQSGSFSIGSAIINKLTLSIDNMDDAYSDYDFTDAVIRPSVGLQLSASIETLNKGVFIADDPHVKSSTITLTALDNMVKFDKPFSNIVQAFPCSAINLLNTVCTHCGVSIGTSTFDGDDYVIQSRPSTSDATNCREIVSWIAQLGGNFARCNINGALEIKWYDLSVFEEETNLDGGYFDETQVTYTESKSGTSITSSETARNSIAEITKIEGASYQAVTVQGKNMFDFDRAIFSLVGASATLTKETSSVLFDGLSGAYAFQTQEINVTANTNYAASCLAALISGAYGASYGTKINYVTTGTYSTLVHGSWSVAFNTGANTKIRILFYAGVPLSASCKFRVSNIQLEKGTAVTSYAPFVPNSPSPTYPSTINNANNFNLTASNSTDSNSLTVTQSMGALPNGVKNEIVKVNGVTKYIQRVGKKSFTGTENWGLNNYRFQLANGIVGGVNTNLHVNAKNVLCTHFMNHVNEDQLDSGAYDNAVGLFLQTGTTGYIGFVNKSTATIADFKAFLAAQNSAGNPVTVYYPLATPIETIMPELTLTTYKGTTSITTTSNPQVNITAGFHETIGVQDKYYSGDSADGGTFSFVDGDNIDGGSFTIQNRYHGITFHTGLSLSTDDVVITGITAYDSSEQANSYTFGTSGYLIQIEKNELIQNQSDAQTVATLVGNKLVGTRFRPLSLTAKSNPSIEAGDVTKVSDRKGNVYNAFLSNVSYAVWQSMKLSCDAESPTRNSATRYSETTKATVEARNTLEKKLTAYDIAVQQMTSLIVHAFGLYKTSETLEDGSTIFYSHDKPTRAESSFVYQENSNGFFVSNDGGQTWNSGWDSEGNAVFNVLSAIGINAEWINVITSFTVGGKFSVGADGKLVASDADISGKITATTGKIANMDIDSDGFVMDEAVVDKFFRWQVGETLMQFFEDTLDIYSRDIVKLHGTRYEILASNNGFNISYTNPGGGSCGISAQEGVDGAILIINASNASGYLDKNILVNGIPVFQQLATALSDISTIKQQVTGLQSQIDFYH